jgi:Ca2+-binding EF-hand superfamily protein
MRWSHICVRAAVCMVVLAGAVRVQAQENFRAKEFREKDKNHDGYLNRSEYAGHPGNYRALDHDGDGRLSRSEYVDRAGKGAVPSSEVPMTDAATARYQSRDLNHDGALTRSEWRDETAFFDGVDRNDDGRITLDEYRNPPTGGVEDRFSAKDRNHDGVLSRSEWRDETVVFNRADPNNDGVVTLREYRVLPAVEPREARFNQLDRDRDGVLERGEWPRDENVAHDRADRNRDGMVSFQEFAALPPADYREENFDELDRDNNGVVSRQEWRGDAAEFDRLDRNDDRIVTLWEFRQPATTATAEDRFQELDQNRDGRVSRAEWHGDSESFAILDGSRDRVLTLSEFRNRTRLSERFGWLDQNDDGRLSRDEWEGSADAFAFFDRNRDGTVTREEYAG